MGGGGGSWPGEVDGGGGSEDRPASACGPVPLGVAGGGGSSVASCLASVLGDADVDADAAPLA